MGTKLSACQNPVVALIFPINHAKNSTCWFLLKKVSSLFLNNPRIHGAYMELCNDRHEDACKVTKVTEVAMHFCNWLLQGCSGLITDGDL